MNSYANPAEDIFKTVNTIQQKVIETEEEFIFSTINNYIEQITEIKIEKKELLQAISLIRLNREAIEKYGTMLSNDWDTATRQMTDLRSAYSRGYQDGRKSVIDKVDDILNREGELDD